METNNEIKDFNIAEALKYAPKGLKLYSPIFGEVRFKEIDDDNWIQVIDKYNNHRWFYEYGTFFPSDESNFSESECLLFPSTNHRCCHCKHYVDGHTGLYIWLTKVCDAKPKVLSKAMEKRKENHKTYKDYTLYYSAQRYGKPCEMFELKEEKKNDK